MLQSRKVCVFSCVSVRIRYIYTYLITIPKREKKLLATILCSLPSKLLIPDNLLLFFKIIIIIIIMIRN